jgi:ribosomal protein RSM22 (predicted rRNA methylase)
MVLFYIWFQLILFCYDNFCFQYFSVGIDSSSLSEEQKEDLKFKYKNYIIKHLKETLYSWKPVLYDKSRALQYMVARFAPEYAVLQKIFMEMKTREPDFHPLCMLDFGSGVGTATW